MDVPGRADPGDAEEASCKLRLGCRVQGLGVKVWVLGFTVKGLRVEGPRGFTGLGL